MPRNTSVTLVKHFDGSIQSKVQEGRYGSTSEAICAGLRPLEVQTKLDRLKAFLASGEAQLDQGQGIDGDELMKELIDG